MSLFWKQDWVKTGFQIEVLTLIHNLTENRLRHARGPVHYHQVHYMNAGFFMLVNCNPFLTVCFKFPTSIWQKEMVRLPQLKIYAP